MRASHVSITTVPKRLGERILDQRPSTSIGPPAANGTTMVTGGWEILRRRGAGEEERREEREAEEHEAFSSVAPRERRLRSSPLQGERSG